MPLFTILLEFGGGTYVSQVQAASLKGAKDKYCLSLATQKFGTGKTRRELAEKLKDDEPTALSDIRNVWCLSVSIGRKLALLNIVSTAD
jgi:hypothetical protein